MKQVLYLIQKEFRQVFRDKPMLFIIFFVPVVQMVVLGFAITIDVKNVSTVIVDFDRSSLSREIARRFQNSPYFDVKGHTSSLSKVRSGLDDWRFQLAVVVPRHFGRDVERGLRPGVQILVDGVDGNTAGIALGYATGLLGDLATVTVRAASRSVVTTSGATASSTPAAVPGISSVVPETRLWYNLDLESKNYMVPGLIAVLLTIISMFLTSMGLVREKEMGTLEQLLVTPIRTWQLILGKVLPFLMLSFVELVLMLIIAFLVFGLTIEGSVLLLFCLAGLYLLSTLGLGIFISTLAQTQQQALFIAWFFMVFLIFMSGFLFPIENMPFFIQKLTYLDAMRYFMTIVREIFLKGSPPRFLLGEIAILAGIGACILFLSSLRFRKRVA